MCALYTVAPAQQLDASLSKYLATGFPESVSFDAKAKTYSSKGQLYGGLVNTLKSRYYPKYKDTKRRKKTQKKGSNSVQGKRVDAEIMKLLEPRDVKDAKKGKPLDPFTVQIRKYWADHGHTLQASQLPVFIKRFSKISQIDCITRDHRGKLWLWEVKSGFTPGMNTTRGKGNFAAPLQETPITKARIWNLQRYWLHRAAVEAGIDIYQSRVLNVYHNAKKKQDVAVALKVEPFLKLLDETPTVPRARAAPVAQEEGTNTNKKRKRGKQ